MKKVVLIGLLVMWVFGMFLILCIVPSSNVSATGDPIDMGGWYETPGDWVVDGSSSLSYTNTTIIVNGLLTVTAPYTLTLTNVTLQMNCTIDGEYSIIVLSGGSLIIKDYDDNPLTNGDRSMVESSIPDGAHRFGFIVFGPNGELTMTNSELRDCGWEENPLNNWQNSGLWVGTTNPANSAIITGNYIHDCVSGVVFYNCVGGNISNNDFEQCSHSGVDLNATTDVVVEGNTFTTCGNSTGSTWSYSLHGWSDTNADILNNHVTDHQYFGLFMEDQTDLTMDGNIVRDCTGSGAGLVIYYFAGDTYATNNEVYNISWTGFYMDGMSGPTSNTYANNNSVHDIYVDEAVTWSAIVGQVYYNLIGDRTWIHDNVAYNLGETGANMGITIGIAVWGGTGHSFLRNTVYDVSDIGVMVDADNVIVDDCDMYSNGDGDSSWDGDSGIYIDEVSNTIIKNSRIFDNHPPIVGTNDVQGIFVYDSINTLIQNCDISNNEINIRGLGDGVNPNDALIENCSLDLGLWGNNEFDLDLDSDFTTLNTTFDNSSINFNDGASSLTCKWYLHVQVRETGSGVNGAEIWVNDSLASPDPSTGQPFTTQTIDGEPGWVRWIPVTEFVETDSGKTYYTPHAINATLPGKGGRAISKIWKSQEVIINLNNVPQIIDVQFDGGATIVYRNSSIFVYINANDVEDSEDMLIVYVEYRVNDGAPWETVYLVGVPIYVGSAPSGYWIIEFMPPTDAPLGWYDFRFRVEDTYPSSSGWYTYMDAIEVLNNPPVVVNLTSTSYALFRGEIAYITIECDDVEDGDQPSSIEIEYRSPSGTWSGPDTTLGSPYYTGSNWVAEFTPRTGPTKDEIGWYDFRVRCQDSDGVWSAWEERLDWIEVLNNPPQADSLDASESFVYRNAPGSENNYVWLFANVTEVEDSEDWLTVLFEYYEPGVGWDSAYIDHVFTLSYDSFAGLWKVQFKPPDFAALGFYNFRVTFTDLDGDLDTLTINGLVEVRNNPPDALDITPSAPNIRAGAPAPIHLNVNGSDTEDSESELTIVDIEWQYNGPSGGDRPGTWSATWFGSSGYSPSGGGYLWVEFSPPGTATPGYYGFRVKVTDLDTGKSTWIEIYDAVYVASPEPVIDDVTPQASAVYRNEQIVITLNGSDGYDPEDQLTPYVEYRKVGSSTWIEIVGSPSYNATWGYWEVYWTPNATMDLGQYEFQGRFENTDGYFSNYTVAVFDVTILNNPPVAIDITPSDTSVTAGVTDILRIKVNADDVEDDESQLTIVDIEWQYNGLSGGERPGTWSGTWFDATGYEPTGGGYLWVEFEPPSGATPGYYGFRVKVSDLDSDMSDPWIEIYDAVEVLSPQPVMEYVTPEANEIFRGDQLTIRMSGSDAVDPEDNLIPHLEYRKKGTSVWTEISGTTSYNVAGYWEVYWTPDIALDLGQYEFQGRFENTDGVFSDYMAGDFDVTVKNNLPQAIDLGVVGVATTVDRGSKITLYANGFDEETPEDQLTAYFEYRAPGDSWDNAYFSGKTYNDVDNRWEIDFEPDVDAELGDYDFRIHFRDADNDDSDYIELIDLIEVQNVPPIVLDISVDPATAYREETIIITADGADADGSEAVLTVTFEYKSSSGSWTPVPGSASYVGSSFRITWAPGSNDELGQYDFRVKFFDGNDESFWMESLGSFTLMETELDVLDLTAPQSGYRTQTVYISANASYPNGNEADFTAMFQYKGPTGDWVSHDDPNSYFDGAPEFIVDYWRIGFTPPADAELGFYSFRVNFSHGTNNSQWETKTNWYNLLNNPPQPIWINVPSEVFRLESIQISADGSDVETNEADLSTYYDYKGPTGDWISHTDAGGYFVGTPEYIDGSWHIGFNAPVDAELGMYSLRVRFSDGIDERGLIIGFRILNNPPATVDLTVPESGYRVENIYISANGSDVDHIESDLVPEFEFKGPGDSDWIGQDDAGSYFSGAAEFVDDFWRIPFDPSANVGLGYYSFRVRFSDGLNTSDWLFANDAFILMNHVPEVSDLSVKDSAYRMDTIAITANVTDMDDLERNLQPTFEYKGPSGTWISQDDTGNYFAGSPEFIDGRWRIEFEPPEDAPLGAYSFRVRFTDGNDTSEWLTSSDALTVMAHPDDKGEEEPSMWMWLLPLIIALLVILLFVILYSRRKKEPEEGLPEEKEGEEPLGEDEPPEEEEPMEKEEQILSESDNDSSMEEGAKEEDFEEKED